MTPADARRLHGPARRQIGGPEAHAVHARARRGNRLDIVDALGCFQKRVNHHRLINTMLSFELGEQLIEIVNIPRPLDLGQHDDVELAAHRAHDLDNVVQHPRAVQRVDARPKPRARRNRSRAPAR